VKLLQEWGEGRQRRMVEGVNSSMIYSIYYNNICKCHNVPFTQQNNKNNYRSKRKINKVDYGYGLSVFPKGSHVGSRAFSMVVLMQ
jgi:pullulanase/glycogen debranching enzyme